MAAAEKLAIDVVPLFADLTDKRREALMELCTIRRYAAGDVILPAGAGPRGEVAFVLEGSVRVGAVLAKGSRIAFEDIPAGSQYGALSALDPRLPLGSVMALSDTVLAILPAPEFLRMLAQNGKAATALLRELAGRLAATLRQEEVDAAGNHVQRVYGELLRLAEPSPSGDGLWLVNPLPRHKVLADMAETTEESAAGAVAHLIRVGLARRRYPALEILDRARIRALCELR